MNLKNKYLFIFLLISVVAYSQGPPPPPPPPGLPIDSGLLCLVVAAIGYGVKKLKD
ncbi:PID-CTERM protein-sorting domain-containing protein [Bacteroidota bacterium]